MRTYDLIQGSPEWMAHRSRCYNAADAAAMLGCSPYETRNELLHRLHTGIAPEPTRFQQALFDEGHEFEALARPLAEKIIGEELYPVVGSPDEDVAGLSRPLSASFDGITMLDDPAFEHKRLNAELRAAMVEGCTGADLPKRFPVQMEQQLLCSGGTRVLFMASEWDDNGNLVEAHHCWYESDPALRAEIIAGWRQLDADLAAYVPRESTPVAVAAPVEALPAVSVRMDGALAVVSNLDVFGTKLREFVAKIPTKPSTDQEFIDCDAAVKALKKAEDALDAAEANALGQVQSVEELTRTIGDLRAVARTARLATNTLVTARKQQIRTEEVQRGKDALAAHIDALNASLGRPLMPPLMGTADFAGAISGKKTLDSLRNAIDTELARVKIAANETAERIRGNLKLLSGYESHLFRDVATLVHKATDDLQAIIAARLAEEQRRQDAERERIRKEESERLEREAAEKARREAENAAAAAAAQAVSEARQAESLPPEVLDAAENAVSVITASMTLARVADSGKPANVVPMQRPTPAPASPPTLKLGEINRRIAPLSIDAAGLRALGFEPAAKDRSAVLFHEQQFPAICDAVIATVARAKLQRAAA